MKSYTFSEARQNFAALLEQACRDGAVRIRRRDGQSFVLTPEPDSVSPLNIPGVTPAMATLGLGLTACCCCRRMRRKSDEGLFSAWYQHLLHETAE
jgi:hypothetical protein